MGFWKFFVLKGKRFWGAVEQSLELQTIGSRGVLLGSERLHTRERHRVAAQNQRLLRLILMAFPCHLVLPS